MIQKSEFNLIELVMKIHLPISEYKRPQSTLEKQMSERCARFLLGRHPLPSPFPLLSFSPSECSKNVKLCLVLERLQQLLAFVPN